jgi:hypothetical protein
MTKKQIKERDEARETLRGMLKIGDTVYTRLNHVSKSGMYRIIELLIIRDNRPQNITYLSARAMGEKTTNHPKPFGIPVGGCGMDMGFSLVYNLGHALFGKPGKMDGNDPGYELHQKWL